MLVSRSKYNSYPSSLCISEQRNRGEKSPHIALPQMWGREAHGDLIKSSVQQSVSLRRLRIHVSLRYHGLEWKHGHGGMDVIGSYQSHCRKNTSLWLLKVLGILLPFGNSTRVKAFAVNFLNRSETDSGFILIFRVRFKFYSQTLHSHKTPVSQQQ